MIKETGIVKKVQGSTATVVVQKRGACEGCAVQGTCESTEKGMEIEALNPLNAQEGAEVKVSIRPQEYLRGTMLVYGLPLVLFIAGAIAGKNFAEWYLPESNSDLVAALAGFASLIISLFGIKVWAGKMESKAEYKPVIEEILKQ